MTRAELGLWIIIAFILVMVLGVGISSTPVQAQNTKSFQVHTLRGPGGTVSCLLVAWGFQDIEIAYFTAPLGSCPQ